MLQAAWRPARSWQRALRGALGHQVFKFGDLDHAAGFQRGTGRSVGEFAALARLGDHGLALGFRGIVPGHAVKFAHRLGIIGIVGLAVGGRAAVSAGGVDIAGHLPAALKALPSVAC